jgi:cyclic pyranopterin phosphate synthase
MPREVFGSTYEFLPRRQILSFEEITRVVRLFAGLGVRKVRLTGGEPLLRQDLPDLVRMLSALPDLDVALTTNGSLLPQQSRALADAGLRRITVSLDSLDDDIFRAMNDVRFSVARVLEGIDAAAAAGLSPIKINAVVRRGMNDQTVVDLARHFKGSGHVLRFIEYMDVGTTNGWRLDQVVSGQEILDLIDAEMPIEPVDSAYRGEVARRWRYIDGEGELGVITSVTRPFCGDCTRTRLSAEGKLYTCLFAAYGTDLKEVLRGGAGDEEILDMVRGIWNSRRDRYSEVRTEETTGLDRIEMSYIGG